VDKEWLDEFGEPMVAIRKVTTRALAELVWSNMPNRGMRGEATFYDREISASGQ
jgi:hypothetical protein